jgi:hypothetical protein
MTVTSKSLVGVVLLMIGTTSLVAQSNGMMVRTPGEQCAEGSYVEVPYSIVYIETDNGNVRSVEHLSCDGVRTVFHDESGSSGSYQAYSSTLYMDNVPKLGYGQVNTITVHLEIAATIEVRDGISGMLIASLPRSGDEVTEYTIPAADLESFAARLIVVDVIRSTDRSFRGTASILHPAE